MFWHCTPHPALPCRWLPLSESQKSMLSITWNVSAPEDSLQQGINFHMTG